MNGALPNTPHRTFSPQAEVEVAPRTGKGIKHWKKTWHEIKVGRCCFLPDLVWSQLFNRLFVRPPSMLDIKVFAGLVLLYVVFQRWKSYSRLKHFNGPVLASLSKLWLLRRIWASNAATEIARVCAEYGEIYTLPPPPPKNGFEGS